VLGLLAFGLEENNLYPQAEEAGRRALAADPRGPWAVHAVAHVMEMQGRFEDGSAWLRQTQPDWAEGNGLAAHLWWHKGLYRLEALDMAGALRLADSHLAGEALQIGLQRIDAAALLWRLQLLGEDVGDRFAALAAGWDLTRDDAEAMAPNAERGGERIGERGGERSGEMAGYYAFNDVHAVVALLGAGEVQRAERHVARCAARALAATEARRCNHLMAREVGLPLMRGLLMLARGEAAAAAVALYPVRALAQRLGGSHAQRDLIDQTLLAAAARAARGDSIGGDTVQARAIGRALLNERIMAKPVTPLTRHWMDAVGERVEARA